MPNSIAFMARYHLRRLIHSAILGIKKLILN